MLIDYTLYTILSIAVPILACIGLSIWVYRRFKNYYGVLIGLVLSGFIFGASQALAGAVYTISKDLDVGMYRVLGATKFQMGNGTVLDAPFEPGKVLVINNTGHELVLEELEYRRGGPSPMLDSLLASRGALHQPDVFYIAPYASGRFSLPQGRIQFFFDDMLPNQLQEYGSKNISLYRLRLSEK